MTSIQFILLVLVAAVAGMGSVLDEVHMHPLSFAEFMTVYQGHYDRQGRP